MLQVPHPYSCMVGSHVRSGDGTRVSLYRWHVSLRREPTRVCGFRKKHTNLSNPEHCPGALSLVLWDQENPYDLRSFSLTPQEGARVWSGHIHRDSERASESLTGLSDERISLPQPVSNSGGGDCFLTWRQQCTISGNMNCQGHMTPPKEYNNFPGTSSQKNEDLQIACQVVPNNCFKKAQWAAREHW